MFFLLLKFLKQVLYFSYVGRGMSFEYDDDTDSIVQRQQ
jgi:hypothetical protein